MAFAEGATKSRRSLGCQPGTRTLAMWPIARRTKRDRRLRRDFVPARSWRSPNPLQARQSLDEICESLVARGDWLWARDELMEAWRDAQADARRAYDGWVISGAASAYLAYRTEQDRADAAQAALAEWAAREPSVPGMQRSSGSGRRDDRRG